MLSACAAPNTMAPNVSSQDILIEQQKQRELLYAKQIENQDKVYRLSYPIMTKNFEACENKVRPLYGMVMWNFSSIPTSFHKTANQLFGVTDEISIRSIAPRSPASRARLKVGDVIVAINDRKIPKGKSGINVLVSDLKKGTNGPVKLTIRRQGKTFNKRLSPVKGCKYPVLIDKSSSLNAYADGKKIVISKGMMRFVENDNELALVISHELAHNAMLHIDKKKQNVAVGALGGGALDILLGVAGVSSGGQFSQMGANMGAGSNSVAFEQEADYVGMYFMARAGYDTSNVANFWRRLATEGNSSIDKRTSHPTSPERFLSIERTHQEIMLKKKKKQKLVPNLKAVKG